MDDTPQIPAPAALAAAMPADVPPPFPEGSRILHIGPPKTGTTALQVACWRARDSLLEQGVRYAGGQLHAVAPARAVTGRPTITGNRREVPSIKWWHALVREMERAGEPRVLYSSEALAEADDAAIRRIAGDVGPAIQVLVTLRPADVVLAGSWQQSIQNGGELGLEDWLRRAIGDAGHGATSGLQLALRQGELVDRWAEVVGRDRVTVVILDGGDPDFLFSTANALLALRPGTLHAYEDSANRSLTVPEAEVIRRMNVQARQAGIGNGARAHLVYTGGAANAKRRPPAQGSAKVRLPGWALEWASSMSTETIRRLSGSGVRVIGDPARLMPSAQASAGPEPADAGGLTVDPETAATIAMGVAWGFGLRLGPDQPGGSRKLAMVFVPTSVLVRQVIKRGLASVRRRRTLAGADDD